MWPFELAFTMAASIAAYTRPPPLHGRIIAAYGHGSGTSGEGQWAALWPEVTGATRMYNSGPHERSRTGPGPGLRLDSSIILLVHFAGSSRPSTVLDRSPAFQRGKEPLSRTDSDICACRGSAPERRVDGVEPALEVVEDARLQNAVSQDALACLDVRKRCPNASASSPLPSFR
jgi:hypothetical protein